MTKSSRTRRQKREPIVATGTSQDREPNRVPLLFRIYLVGLALVMLVYGASGFWNNKLELSTSKGGGGRLVFHDRPAWLLASAIIIGAVLLLSVVVDHYDRRNNESRYQAFRKGGLYVALGLGASAFATYLLVGFLG